MLKPCGTLEYIVNLAAGATLSIDTYATDDRFGNRFGPPGVISQDTVIEAHYEKSGCTDFTIPLDGGAGVFFLNGVVKTPTFSGGMIAGLNVALVNCTNVNGSAGITLDGSIYVRIHNFGRYAV